MHNNNSWYNQKQKIDSSHNSNNAKDIKTWGVMKLKCPYCNTDLIEGFIEGGRYSFKWHNKDMNFIEKYTVFGGEVLYGDRLVKCFRCKNCNKIIIDLNEL